MIFEFCFKFQISVHQNTTELCAPINAAVAITVARLQELVWMVNAIRDFGEMLVMLCVQATVLSVIRIQVVVQTTNAIMDTGEKNAIHNATKIVLNVTKIKVA